jgi:hypothetical protein
MVRFPGDAAHTIRRIDIHAEQRRHFSSPNRLKFASPDLNNLNPDQVIHHKKTRRQAGGFIAMQRGETPLNLPDQTAAFAISGSIT